MVQRLIYNKHQLNGTVILLFKESDLVIVSTKGRYALRVIIDLAINGNDEYISLKDISERSLISMKYLESIVSNLNKHGLLDSLRGKKVVINLTDQPVNIQSV